jgi:hypothetical protein
MAKRNARQMAAASRDKRAKVMLGVFGLVFLAVLGFEVPHLLKHGSSPAAAVTGTTAVPTSTAGGVAAAPGVTTSALQAATQPQSGQLARFSEFSAKDPFHPGVNPDAVSGGGGSETGTTTTAHPAATPSATKSAAPPKTLTTRTNVTKPRHPSALVPAAVLQFDGNRVVVLVGSAFPAKKPVFRLEALGRNAMWVSLLHGTFGHGVQLLQLRRGHPTKVADSTGKSSYMLELVRVTTRKIPVAENATTTKSTTTTTVTTSQATTSTSGTTTTAAP